MIVCIDPGHGGEQPGAVSPKYGYKEKDIVLDISLKVKSLLESKHKVIMTRISDKNVALSERCKLANRNKADIFVSIHCNSCTSSIPSGIETWCYDSEKSRSRALAKFIQDSLMKEVRDFLVNGNPIKSRGVKATTAYYTIRHTAMPSVVVECGFMSNPSEVGLLYSREDYREHIALGIANGVEQYCKAF